MDIIKERFIKQFGDKEANKIIEAALSHRNGINDKNYGTSKFRWAICICLGYECMENKEYKKYHGIETSWKKLKLWIKKYAELAIHDGDIDYIAAFIGIYDEYIKKEPID